MEVSQQLMQLFNPDPKVIKARIEDLITRVSTHLISCIHTNNINRSILKETNKILHCINMLHRMFFLVYKLDFVLNFSNKEITLTREEIFLCG